VCVCDVLMVYHQRNQTNDHHKNVIWRKLLNNLDNWTKNCHFWKTKDDLHNNRLIKSITWLKVKTRDW